MIKTELSSGGVDGLSVKFLDGFYFDTWQQAFEFVRRVHELQLEIEKKQI